MTRNELPTAPQLAYYGLLAQHPLTRKWLPDSLRLELLAEEHEFDLQLATDLELARQRAEFLKVGPPAEAYLNRWVTVSADLDAMLSIRFYGMDITKPFVDVSVGTRPLQASDFADLKRVAVEVYGMFKPGKVRFFSAAPAGAFAGTTPDMRFLGAPLSQLRGREVPAGLTLAPTRDLTHYAQAQAAYAAVDTAHPNHPTQAKLLSGDDLQECMEAGTMFDVLLDGIWSGYAATLPETKLGLPAQVVQELLLAPHARGRGLGQHLSPLMAQALPDDGRVLIGTIHGENAGALRAALLAGRHDCGGYIWIPAGVGWGILN